MESKLKVENPDKIKMTLSVTMELTWWKRLRSQLSNNQGYPASDICREIRDMVDKAEQEFEANEETQ